MSDIEVRRTKQITTSGSGGALYLVFTQVASRALTFLGNQFLLRYLSPGLLGLAVQLELLSVTILYFSRESLRVALQRQPRQQVERGQTAVYVQQIVNLAYLAIVVGLCASVGFGYGYLQKSTREVLESVNFWLAFQIYGIATFLELIAEPFFLITQQYALYKVRARAETTAAMARCLASCLTTLIMSYRGQPASVVPFAVGQLFYAVALFAVYLLAVLSMTKNEAFSLVPRKIAPETVRPDPSDYWMGLFSTSTLSLVATFYAQSIFKLILTQGDSLIISFLTDLKSQGAFALASNYGGLLSRLIFQPVEESSRNVFGRLVGLAESNKASSSSTNSATAKTSTKDVKVAEGTLSIDQLSSRDDSSSSNIKLDHSSLNATDNLEPTPNRPHPSSPRVSAFDQALSHLTTTLHVFTLGALPILTLVPPLLGPLTNIFLPSQWRNFDTTALLAAYIWYLPFLALNGVLDAFVTSVATPAQLRAQSLLMALITAVYGFVAFVLMGTGGRAAEVRARVFGPDDDTTGGSASAPWGGPGLVYANMVNMAMRIAYAVWFIGGWTRAHRRRRAVDNSGGAKQQQTTAAWWKRALPAASCVAVAVAVGVGLRNTLPSAADMEKASLSSRRFMGIQGLSREDLGYVFGAALILGSTMLISERQFLIEVVMPIVPERFASKIRPYLPKTAQKEE